MKVRGIQFLTVVLATIMMLALSVNAMAAKSNAVTKDGVTAQMFTDKDSYKTGESVKASIQVDNHTGEKVYVIAQMTAPDGVVLENADVAFDAFLETGESWEAVGGVVTSASNAAGAIATVGNTTATGDNMQAGLWVILTVLAVSGLFVLFVYGKTRTTWLSIMLCIAMVGGMVVAAVPVQAGDMSGNISLSCTIQVDDKEKEIAATVSYLIYDEAEEVTEIPIATATPEMTEAPTATATPEATEAPTATPEATEAPTATPVATEAPTYIVTFMNGTETMSTSELEYGTVIIAPVEPTKTDVVNDDENMITKYTFSGWKNGNDILEDGDTVVGAVTYTADYAETTYKVTFKDGATLLSGDEYKLSTIYNKSTGKLTMPEGMAKETAEDIERNAVIKYTFNGWKQEGKENAALIKKDEQVLVEETAVYVADYTETPLTITLPTSEESIVFSDDFENYPEGVRAKKDFTANYNSWSKAVLADASPLTIGAEGENQYLLYSRAADQTKNGGPALQLYFTNEETTPVISVSFDANTIDGKMMAKIVDIDGDDDGTITAYESTDYNFEKARITVAIDFKQMIYETYIDGVRQFTKRIPETFDVNNQITFSLQAYVAPGKQTAIDNVVFRKEVQGIIDLEAVDKLVFSDDFEHYPAGVRVKNDFTKTYSSWSKAVLADASPLTIVAEGENQYLLYSRAADQTKNGGPAIMKYFDNGSKTPIITASFDAIMKDGKMTTKIQDGNGESITAYESTNYNFEKARVTVAIDLEKKVYETYIDGVWQFTKEIPETFDVNNQITFSLQASVAPGKQTAIDNVEFRVNNSTKEGSRIDLTAATYEIFADDFEAYEVEGTPTYDQGDATRWNYATCSNGSPLKIAEEGENQYLAFKRLESYEGSGAPGIMKYFANGDTTPVIIASFNNQVMTGTMKFSIRDLYGTSVTAYNSGDYANTNANTTVAIDYAQKIYELFIDGEWMFTEEFPEAFDIENKVTYAFQATVDPGEVTAIDDVKFYSSNEGIPAVEINIDEMFAELGNTEILESFSDTHPRIWFTGDNSFENIKTKIANCTESKRIYDSIKAYVDSDHLNKEPFVKPTSVDRSPHLSWSRSVENRLIGLAFMYCMTGEEVYKTSALNEIKNALEVGNWIAGSALAVSEVSTGISIAYDWLYNDLSVEERSMIEQGLVTNAVLDMALGLTGNGGISNYSTDIYTNRGNVNFGSVMIVALALYDVYPECTSYMLEEGCAKLKQSMTLYEPDGAWYEGTQYWLLATRYATFAAEAVQTALKENVNLPQSLDFYNGDGFKRTPEYIMYTNGTVGSFNYGDAQEKLVTTGPMYWFAKQYDMPSYAAYQYNFYDKDTEVTGYLSNRVFRLLTFDTTAADASNFASLPLGRMFSSENCDLLTARSSWESDDATYVGVQGGTNAGGHTLYSLGTFIMEANGVRWITMRPKINYDWPEARSQYYQSRAEGQNVIVFEPDETAGQDEGGTASSLYMETDADGVFGVMDLKGVHSSKVTSYLRGIRIDSTTGALLMQDEVVGQHQFESGYWFAHTSAEIAIAEDGKSAVLTQDGERLLVRIVSAFDGAKLVKMDAEPLATSPNPADDDNIDYGEKLAIDISGQKDFTLAVEFIPLNGEENTTVSPFGSVQPINNWKTEN